MENVEVGRVVLTDKSATGLARIVGVDPCPNPYVMPWRIKAVQHPLVHSSVFVPVEPKDISPTNGILQA